MPDEAGRVTRARFRIADEAFLDGVGFDVLADIAGSLARARTTRCYVSECNREHVVEVESDHLYPMTRAELDALPAIPETLEAERRRLRAFGLAGAAR